MSLADSLATSPGLGMPSFVPVGAPVARSKEAPMQWDYEKPRTFPESPFFAQRNNARLETGEPSRKRTHYDAMEVDTPPRPAVVEPDNRATSIEPESLGLHEQQHSGDEQADKSLVMVDAFTDDSQNVPPPDSEGVRRRRRSSWQPHHKATSARSDEQRSTALLDVPSKEFSFQVHHHHNAPNSVFDPNALASTQSMSRILLGYVQLASISLLSVLVLSLLLLFLYTLYTDIAARLAAMTVELRGEILACARAYVDNRCEPPTRIPAMEERCASWEECMRREVVVHGKTKVVAETLAEIVNGFVEVISFRTMIFLVGFLSSTVYVSSFAISLLPKQKQPPAHYVPLSAPQRPADLSTSENYYSALNDVTNQSRTQSHKLL